MLSYAENRALKVYHGMDEKANVLILSYFVIIIDYCSK